MVRMKRLWLVTAGLLLCVQPGSALAQSPEPITYTLRFPAPQTHYLSVEASVPTGGRPQVELMMAVWTPGSYLVREFARHVEAVAARTVGGAPLTVEKSRKNRWRVSTGGVDRIVVSYLVYGREMSVRTNWIEADFAMLNGAPTFLTLADDDSARPHDVTLELPAGWSRSLTGLAPRTDRGPHTYRAADFDTLVDSPIVAGTPAVYEFEVADTPHMLVNLGESGVWDGPQSAQDVEKIAREIYRMWGVMPYDRYLFFNMITEAGGGLEHRNFCAVDEQPLGHHLTSQLSAMAGARQPRVVSRLERQAPPPGRARSVRLRERGTHGESLGGRGDHFVLR